MLHEQGKTVRLRSGRQCADRKTDIGGELMKQKQAERNLMAGGKDEGKKNPYSFHIHS
jgi:hypothetical protein